MLFQAHLSMKKIKKWLANLQTIIESYSNWLSHTLKSIFSIENFTSLYFTILQPTTWEPKVIAAAQQTTTAIGCLKGPLKDKSSLFCAWLYVIKIESLIMWVGWGEDVWSKMGPLGVFSHQLSVCWQFVLSLSFFRSYQLLTCWQFVLSCSGRLLGPICLLWGRLHRSGSALKWSASN